MGHGAGWKARAVNVFAGAVAVLLGVWFLMTALVQLPYERCKRLRAYVPVVHLLPGWNFFAPKPITADYAVFYRAWPSFDGDSGEALADSSQPWQELVGIQERRLADAFVNPGRITRKAIHNCSDRITKRVKGVNIQDPSRTGLPTRDIVLSQSYVMLIAKVSSLCPDAAAAQFRIDLVRYGSGEPRASTLFHSAVHWVEPAPRAGLA
jgi:hypothetical protein